VLKRLTTGIQTLDTDLKQIREELANRDEQLKGVCNVVNFLSNFADAAMKLESGSS
jgi:hypothetical protein